MTLPTPKNRIGQATATTGTGTITLGAAESGYAALAAGDDGKYFDYVIEDGTAWEVVREGLFAWNGGTNPTLTRGTLEASSTGSAISLSGAAVVYVTQTAHRITAAFRGTRGFIDGGGLTYNSTTAIDVAALTCAINGKILTAAGGTYTSGSTMKDLANATVTIGASKRYNVFAYDNSGTLEIRFEDRDGTGDGGSPTFDTDLDYWKAATTGAAARRIGAFWTNSSSQIIPFTETGERGRLRVLTLAARDALTYVNYVGNTSFTAITLTPWVESSDEKFLINHVLHDNNAAATAQSLEYSIDSGTSSVFYTGLYIPLNGYVSPGWAWIQNSGTLHYKGSLSTMQAYVTFSGIEVFV